MKKFLKISLLSVVGLIIVAGVLTWIEFGPIIQGALSVEKLDDGVSCGNCATHCPVGAIQMIAENPNEPGSLKVPVINPERCIGCGACEYLCPARPLGAIYVEGREVHKEV